MQQPLWTPYEALAKNPYGILLEALMKPYRTERFLKHCLKPGRPHINPQSQSLEP